MREAVREHGFFFCIGYILQKCDKKVCHTFKTIDFFFFFWGGIIKEGFEK